MADDNFLVDLDRASDCGGIGPRRRQLQWSIQATTNLAARLPSIQLALLRRSGMHQSLPGYRNRFAESYEAHEQRVSGPWRHLPIHGALHQGWHHPFVQYHFWLSGGRRGKNAVKRSTYDGRVPALPGAEFWTNIFTPYPGSPIFHRAKEIGIEVPKIAGRLVDYFPRYTTSAVALRARITACPDDAGLSRLLLIALRLPLPARAGSRETIRHLTAYPARWRLDPRCLQISGLRYGLNRTLKNLVNASQAEGDAKMMGPETARAAPDVIALSFRSTTCRPEGRCYSRELSAHDYSLPIRSNEVSQPAFPAFHSVGGGGLEGREEYAIVDGNVDPNATSTLLALIREKRVELWLLP